MDKKRNVVTGAIIGAASVFVIFGALSLGIFIGRNSKFENIFPFWERRQTFQDHFPDAFNDHGIIGSIDSIGNNTIVVKDRKGTLKTVLVNEQTKIKRGTIFLKFSDLKANEQVIVLGDLVEKENALKATIIRVMSDKNPASSSANLQFFRRGFRS